ncbi:DNA-directed RNA polymerases I and III subunit RPAC1 isoform X2 [Parasteatoda tepidariorum]|nr:DNA-directed RNA polymerases I and III subunit RPAC1 isoform X2 [Parasteatoda tepidariorum]
MKIVSKNDETMEFDIAGLGPPIVNAIRRILIAEVPTMAIDKIEMYNNTTILPDEVLAHRIGLIPFKVDPRLFTEKAPDDDQGTEEDTLTFELKVKCTKKPNTPKDILVVNETTCNHPVVYSRDFKFIPIKNQKEMYGDIRPVCDDIMISKMKPGHEIDLKAYCYKNIGREHAKFSPVSIASYRLLPELRLLEEICGDRAYKLASCFPKGVIKISNKKGREVAKVVNSRNITCSRNVLCHEDLKDAVEIVKLKEHYIFTVETTGALPPEQLVKEAINILKEKCRCFLNELKKLEM